MDVTLQKLDIIHWITELKDYSKLDFIEQIKNSDIQSDWWNEISFAEKKSIELGLQQMNEGKVISHSNVRKRYEKWLAK